MTEENRPWQRRPTESIQAYDAFRVYMKVRTLEKTCKELGKSWQLISRWSSQHDWVERVKLFNDHLNNAETDGLIHQVAESRDKNIALMDKLRGLLNDRLDTFIERKQDPTVAWTRAVEAMARVEANSLMLGLKNQGTTTAAVTRVEELVEKLAKEYARDSGS